MKLSLRVLLILAVFIIFISYLILFQLAPSLRQKYLEEIEEEYNISIENNARYIEGYIDDISNDLDYISKMEGIYFEDIDSFTNYKNAESPAFAFEPNEVEAAIIDFFREYKESNSDIIDIYVGLPNGALIIEDPYMVIGNGKDQIYNFDPRVRPWYKKAIEAPGEIIVSPLYQRIRLVEGTDIEDPQNYYVTIARTVENEDGDFVGVLGIDIDLHDVFYNLDAVISEEVHTIGIVFADNIACIYENGEIEVIPDIHDFEMAEQISLINQNSAYITDASGEDIWVVTKSSAKFMASLFYMVDMDTINDNMVGYLDTIIVTIVSSLLIFVVLILLMVQFYIVMPINKLNKVTSQIRTTMDLSQKVRYKSNDEIGSLANNFNYLMQEIKTYRDHLDEIVKRRTLQLSKFSAAIEQSSAAVIIADLNGSIEYVSPMFMEMTGYTEKEVLGQNPRILKSGVHTEEFYKELWGTVTSGNVWEGIFQNKKKNGEIFFDRSIITPIISDEGAIINYVAIKEDITERKMTAEKLNDALEDKELILESVGEGIIGIDLYGKISFVNRVACDISGYSKEEIEGNDLSKIINVKSLKFDDKKIDIDWTMKQINKGVELHSEKQTHYKKNGEKVIIEVGCVPITRDTKHIGAVIVFRDVTDKLKAESNLEALFRNMPTGFADHEMIYDENGKAIDYRYNKINDSFIKQTGFGKDSLGKTIREIMPNIEDEWIATYAEIVREQKPKTFENYSAAIGKYFRVTSFPTGEHTFATIFDDITESKMAQKLLSENEKRLSFIFETTPFAVVTTVHGIIHYANANFVKMTGLGLRDSAIEAYCNPEDRVDIVSSLQAGEEMVTREIKLFNAQKEVIHVLISIMRSDTEGEAGLLGWLMDISDIKRVEEQLIIAKEQAEAAASAKSDFLANMSHEIRTPMNAVIGLNKLLQSTNMSIRQADYVEKIDRSAAQLMNIINDILDFSKIESGKMEVENIEFNIEDIIKDQISIVSLNAYKKNIEIIVDKDLDVPEALVGDPHRLGQIVGNLINNAIKFTDHGHVMISIGVEERKKEKITLTFVISDTGIGMSQAQVRKLFQPFTQADTSTTRKYGGTGLGLVITKELVEMMNGAISVESRKNEGSSFKFTIPFRASENKRKDYHLSEDIDILVVEENILTRNVIGKYLTQFGYTHTLAQSGANAVNLIMERRFDVILMHNASVDLHRVIWEKINELYENRVAPKILFMQNANENNVAIDADDAPFEILVKPIFPSILYDALSKSLNDKKIIRSKADNKGMDAKELKKLNNARILVVEDNEINRLVVKDILKNVGVTVDEAMDGEDAVNAVRTNKYDLVLMDIQMPVLDGYEAARIIRQEFPKEKLPIIALTADAIIETRNKVISIGMNDYLSKPIDVNKLYSKLVKWLKIKNAFTTPSDADNNAEIVEIIKTILYDFNVDESLNRIGNNFTLYFNMLNKFKDDNENLVAQLMDAYDSEDFDRFKFMVHSQKSVTAYVGAEYLSQLFIETEAEYKENGPNPKIKTKLYKIEKQFNNIFNEIKILNNKFKEMKIFEDKDEGMSEKQDIADELSELKSRIEEKDGDALKLLCALEEKIENKNLQSMLKLAKEYVEKGYTEKAIITINEVLDLFKNLYCS